MYAIRSYYEIVERRADVALPERGAPCEPATEPVEAHPDEDAYDQTLDEPSEDDPEREHQESGGELRQVLV